MAVRTESSIETRIVPCVRPADLSPAKVEREFRELLASGAEIRPGGEAKRNPRRLLALGYVPKYKVELFGTTFYLAVPRQNPDLRFFVAYLVQSRGRGRPVVHPRILYKDVSLIWRSASHLAGTREDFWVGKGDVHFVWEEGTRYTCSMEWTTDLPIELQPALESLSRLVKRVRFDDQAVHLILRRGPEERTSAYPDFTGPRKKAAANPGNLIHGGKSVAWFEKKHDPASLRFASGFEPDFDGGFLKKGGLTSAMYGGPLEWFRFLSKNRQIQYLFLAGAKHVWIIPPQTLTTELSSYGVRTVDVVLDMDLCVPGFEFHYVEDQIDPPEVVSQIPPGFIGAVCEQDETRSDASPWLDKLPIIQEFRRKVLKKGAKGARGAKR